MAAPDASPGRRRAAADAGISGPNDGRTSVTENAPELQKAGLIAIPADAFTSWTYPLSIRPPDAGSILRIDTRQRAAAN
jgi:hypothetical protein